MRTRGTPRGYFTQVRLHRDDILTLADALADERDRFGDEPSDLEVELADLVRRLDRQREVQLGLRDEVA